MRTMIPKSHKNSQLTRQAKSILASFAAVALVIQLIFPIFPYNVAEAAQGSIKTTTESCEVINENHYAEGDDVYIRGENFEEGTYEWTITGQPGGASSDPGSIVASGDFEVTESDTEEFCLFLYTIEEGDEGVYKVDFNGKQDNYTVNGDAGGNPEEPEEETGFIHIQKYICGDDVVFSSGMTPNSSGVADIPEGCEPGGSGWEIETVFEEGNTSTASPYPVDNETDLNLVGASTLGTTNSSGVIHAEVASGGRHFLAESDDENLLAFACEDDSGNHTNNFEIVFVEEDGIEYCNVFNTEEEDNENNISLHITKFVCEPGTEITPDMFPDSGGGYNQSQDCVKATGDLSGQQIGFIFEEGKTDNSGPYPTNFEELGTIDVFGELVIMNNEVAGRYDLAEGDGEGNYPYNPEPEGFIAFGCNTDPGDHFDNYEIAVNTPGETTFCVVYNEGDVGGEEPMGTLVVNKFVCDEGTEFNSNMVPNSEGVATIPEGCELATAGFDIGFVFEEGNTTGSGPFPTHSEFELLGTTNGSGMLSVSVPSGGRHFLAEGDGEGNFPETLDNLIAFACEDDAGLHTNNFEAVFVEEGGTEYCNVYNEGDNGQVIITKYVCEEGTEFNTTAQSSAMPDGNGNATIPEGCELANGFQFGYIHEPDKNDLSPPYPGLDDDTAFTQISGMTGDDGTGRLVLTSLPTGGRLDLAELNENGNRVSDDDVIAFMCNEDTGIADNNYEVVFNEPDKISYCNVYNEADVLSEVDTNLHFIKLVCEQGFNGASGSEPISPNEIPDNCVRTQGWEFALSTDQAQADPEIIGPTDSLGEFSVHVSGLPADLREAVESGEALWISEVEQPDVATFSDLRCYTDAANLDNLEFIQLDPQNMPEDVYCIAYNVELPDSGNVIITKYVCEEGIEFDDSPTSTASPDSSGNATIPEGCELANGFQFGYIHEPDKNDLSPPYPGLDDDTAFTQISGMTGDDGTGRLVLTSLPTGGRLDLAELDSEGNRVPDANVLGFMCSEDVGLAHNNYEVVFNEIDKTSYCNVYNIDDDGTGGGDEITDIHLIKVICDSFAGIDAQTPINPNEIPENCERAEGWHFNLSLDQEQTAPISFGPTAGVNGEVVIGLSEFDEDFEEALTTGGQVWVSEELQDDVATFAALRCYEDAGNDDNLEFIQLDPENMPEDVYCIAYNVDLVDECPDPTNLIANGGFETPIVTDSEGWDVFASGTSGLGWTVVWAEADPGTFDGDTRPATANIELQSGAVVTAQEGSQNAELDADWEGPTGNTTGEPANIMIFQEVDAATGSEYTLTYWAAIRDGSGGTVSDLEVTWNGSAVSPSAGSTSNGWTQYTAVVTGADGMDELAFTETGTGDALGTLLDNVSLILVCEEDNGTGGNGDGGGGGGGGSSSTRRISGVKYNDENGNGIRDNGEDGLGGWIIYIDENDNNVWDGGEEARTTDSDGEYRFSNLSNGDYIVREINLDGWTQTEPGSTDGFEYNIEISSSDRIHDDMDFGNTQGAVLGDSINPPPLAQNGQVLGGSIDVGGGESLPRTGLSTTWMLWMLLAVIGLTPLFMGKNQAASRE